MSLKKFSAGTSREAMIDARRQLGEDAVIISTRKTATGVEVVAASQQELSQIAQPASVSSLAAGEAAVPAPLLRSARATTAESVRGAAREPVPFLKFIQEQPKLMPVATPVNAAAPTFAQTTSTDSAPVMPLSMSHDTREMVNELRQEMSQLRAWMAGQFDAMAYQESMQRRPVAANLQKELLVAGFSPKLARELTSRLPNHADETQARAWTMAVLEKNLLVAAADQDVVDAGGIYALVGPTGVGKTTTIAKLASRCAVKYGRDSVGLITIDSYRIGAQDQLRIYGKILGISVHTAQDRDSLLSVLRSLANKRLVLIDTVGLGQRDERVAELLTTVGASAIKRLLVLNSAAQAETLEDVVARYRGGNAHSPLVGVVLSKTDEAVRLATGMDIAIRHRLPVYYETHGQRVPEDIAFANAKSLVLRATTHIPDRAFQVPNEEVSLTFLQRATQPAGAALHA